MDEFKELLEHVSSPIQRTRQESIEDLEQCLSQYPQLEIPVRHEFHGGIYARQIMIPKGALITGRIQKFDHFDVMISGDITVSTDTGTVKRLAGYNLMAGQAGKKRAGIAHEDTIWVNFHSSPEQDPEIMLDYLTCQSFDEFDKFQEKVRVALISFTDREDYTVLLSQLGTTEHEVREQAENTDDLIDMPKAYDYLFALADSEIEGVGVFLLDDTEAGVTIGPARIDGMRTPFGRYVNHSKLPNARFVMDGNNIELQLTADIKGLNSDRPDEITVNYRQALNLSGITIGDMA